MRSKISLTNEFKMAIALLEIPVSGWTCFNTENKLCKSNDDHTDRVTSRRTLVNIRRVCFLPGTLSLLLITISSRRSLLGGPFNIVQHDQQQPYSSP
jgi:hypothetical protein